MSVHNCRTNVKERLWTRNLIFIMLANCCSSLSFQILIPTLPVYLQYYGHSETVVGFVVGILVLTTILFRPIIGNITDRWNKKYLFVIGLLIIMLSVFSYQFTMLVMPLIFIRLLHGVGWGIVTTAANTLAIDSIPKTRMGEGFGYYGLSSVFSMAVAPAIGLYIIQWGFRLLFITASVLALLGIIFAICITYHRTGSEDAITKKIKLAELFERRAIKPSLINFFISLTFSSITTYITLYAIELGVDHIGVFFMIFSITLFMVRPLTGRMVDQRGYHYVILPGIILIGIGILILIFSKSMIYFIAAAVLYGIGLGAVQPSLQTMVAFHAPSSRYGAANSTFLLSSDLGFGIGAMVWGKAVDVTSYSMMYSFVLIPTFLAFAFQLFNMKNRNQLKK